MEKKLSTIATSAALFAVLFSIWRDYGVVVTLKRALFSYLIFYGLASVFVMIYKAGIVSRDTEVRDNTKQQVSSGNPK